MIMKFAIKAITKITDITIALTNHVVPKILANSVIHFVSISINPAPKKKQQYEKSLLFIFVIFLKKMKEEIINTEIMSI